MSGLNRASSIVKPSGLGRLQSATCNRAVVIEKSEKAVLPAVPTCRPGNTTNRIAVDVVRPDDNTFTNLVLNNRDKVGKCVGSEVSSEVIPVAADLLV